MVSTHNDTGNLTGALGYAMVYEYLFIQPVTYVNGAPWKLWFHFVTTLIIIVLGLISNPLALMIMTSQRMRKHTYSVYLTALSVCDLGNIVTRLIFWINLVSVLVTGRITIRITNVYTCRITMYACYLLMVESSWLVTILSVERLIVVCFPIVGRFLYSRKNAIIVTLCTVMAGVFIHIDSLFPPFRHFYVDGLGCVSDKASKKSHTLKAITLAMFCPLLIIITCNAMIMVSLTRRRVTVAGKIHKRQVRQVTKLLLVVTITFVVCLIPNACVFISIAIRPDSPINVIRPVTNFLMDVNFSVNVFIYIGTSKEVRAVLKGWLDRSVGYLFHSYNSDSSGSNVSNRQLDRY
ncbi:kappa-type opioid receptor-like [Tubulanus polymorphus]|uniref:kappa-type opioid receptor-like n=1 Tax=Tubulanus polymorphus TaxID=672921 RepID=UPI003DA4B4A6